MRELKKKGSQADSHDEYFLAVVVVDVEESATRSARVSCTCTTGSLAARGDFRWIVADL